MRYNIYINQKMSLRYKLKPAEGALIDLLNQLAGWANHAIKGNDVYYNIALGKVIEEIPIFFNSKSTVRRSFAVLREKKLIDQIKIGVNQNNYIKLTAAGAAWNSDNTRVGKSDQPLEGCAGLPGRVGKSDQPLKDGLNTDKQDDNKQGCANLLTYNTISITSNNIIDKKIKIEIRKKLAIDQMAIFFNQVTPYQKNKIKDYFINLDLGQYENFINQFYYYVKYKTAAKQDIKYSFYRFSKLWPEQDYKAVYSDHLKANPNKAPGYTKDSGANKKIN